MLVVSQYKDKTTQCLEFIIKKEETCRSIFVDKASYEKFKKITQKKDDGHFSTKELKGLGELIEKNMTKHVHILVQRKTHENFGTFSSKDKAKEVLQKMIQAYENGNKKYEIPQDENAELILF